MSEPVSETKDTAQPSNAGLDPVIKTVEVSLSPERAFRAFTDGLDRWWPKSTRSVSGERTASCVIEPRVGGAVYEVRDDGETFPWGRILRWSPPHGFTMSWHPGRPEAQAQEVELRFVEIETGTRVELEHRGWELLGAEAQRVRSAYDGGWEPLLGEDFAGFCATL